MVAATPAVVASKASRSWGTSTATTPPPNGPRKPPMYSGSVPGPVACRVMLRRKVTSPDGRTWTLGRRWMPARRKLGRVDIGDIGIPDVSGGLDDLGIVGTIIAAILLAHAGVVIALVLFNVLAIAIEFLIVLVALVAGVVGRVVFRRPWTVFARWGAAGHYRPVAGWPAGRRALDEMAARLSSGSE